MSVHHECDNCGQSYRDGTGRDGCCSALCLAQLEVNIAARAEAEEQTVARIVAWLREEADKELLRYTEAGRIASAIERGEWKR